MPNEISVVFHNNSKYDYHFIIQELANEFEGHSKIKVEFMSAPALAWQVA